MAKRGFRSPWLPVVVWLGVIAVLGGGGFSSDETSRIIGPILRWLFPEWSGDRVLAVQGLIRKLAHPTEYAVLGALAGRALVLTRTAASLLRAALPALALVAVTALADEARQGALASRTGSLFDVGLDLAGGALGALAAPALLRRRARPGGDGG